MIDEDFEDLDETLCAHCGKDRNGCQCYTLKDTACEDPCCPCYSEKHVYCKRCFPELCLCGVPYGDE